MGWISDRFGHRVLIALFSLASVAAIVAVPWLGSGLSLVIALGALGAFLWALRPVIASAALGAAPQQLAGSVIAVIYGANMSVAFLAPLIAGVMADAYGLPAAITAIAIFPALASIVTLLLLNSDTRK